jgi:hypothetical protein
MGFYELLPYTHKEVEYPRKIILSRSNFPEESLEEKFFQDDGYPLTKRYAGINMGADSFGFFKEIHSSKYKEVLP